MLNLTDLLVEASKSDAQDVPPQLPVTALDMDRLNGIYDMDLHMADPCAACGAFRMHVGDYVCWGVCHICYEEAISEISP